MSDKEKTRKENLQSLAHGINNGLSVLYEEDVAFLLFVVGTQCDEKGERMQDNVTNIHAEYAPNLLRELADTIEADQEIKQLVNDDRVTH